MSSLNLGFDGLGFLAKSGLKWEKSGICKMKKQMWMVRGSRIRLQRKKKEILTSNKKVYRLVGKPNAHRVSNAKVQSDTLNLLLLYSVAKEREHQERYCLHFDCDSIRSARDSST